MAIMAVALDRNLFLAYNSFMTSSMSFICSFCVSDEQEHPHREEDVPVYGEVKKNKKG